MMNDKNKINQATLKYYCGYGTGMVNLYTGRLLFEHPDVSMGINSYQVEVSHIYNSQSDFNSYMGRNWSLNVQQRLYIEGDSYCYVDNGGHKHSFARLIDNKYYDTSGLGLILTALGNTIDIEDETGNKMIF